MNGPPRPVRRGVRGALCVPAFASILALSAIALAEDPKVPVPELPALPPAASSSAAAAPSSAPVASSSAAAAPPEAPSSAADVDLLLPSIPADPPTKKPGRATGTSRASPGRAAPAGTDAAPASTASAAVATATFVPPPSPSFVADPDFEKVSDDEAARARAESGKSFTPAMQVGFHAFFWPYLASAVVGGVALEGNTSSDMESLGFLVLPGIGPFLSLAVMNDSIGDVARGTLLADGIVQSVGLTTLILAAALRGPARPQTTAAKQGPSVTLAPGPGTGLGIRGSF